MAAPSGNSSSASEPTSVPDQLLVGYRQGASEAHRAEARGRANAQLVDRVTSERGDRTAVELVKFHGIDRAEATRRFTSNPNVSFAEPNWVYTHDAVSDDPYYTQNFHWGMYGDASPLQQNPYGSQAAEAWAAGNTGDGSVYVGIIDEGYQYTHPDLADNVGTNPGETGLDAGGFDKAANSTDDDGNGYVDDVFGWDFDGGDNSVYDNETDDHGTHVAGTIGAEGGNTEGVAGVVWDVKLLSAKFLGLEGGTTANAVKAVDYFTDLKTRHKLNLVATNNSWSGGGYSAALKDAIVRANTANIVFVAAAGNAYSNNDVTATYPANYDVPNVISVAAIDQNGNKANFSNYGATTVDLGAPGVSIWSTLPGGYGAYGGTSMAAPHVTGAVALYASAAATSPSPSVATIRSAILSTVVPTTALSNRTVTGGRLNISTFVAGSLPAPVPVPVLAVTVTVGAKKKSVTPVTVRWSGFTGTSVDFYKNTTRTSTSNDGLFTENLKGSGTVVYKVCETGTSTCAQVTLSY